MTRRLALAVALLLVAGALAPGAAAAANCPRTSLGDIEDEVMCLQCGVPLNVAEEAPSAKRERAFIQEQVDRCATKQQIKDQLVAQFGERVLAEPKKASAWVVPALGFAGGVLAIALAAYRWRSRRGRGPAAPAAGTPLSSTDAARLDADMERYEP